MSWQGPDLEILLSECVRSQSTFWLFTKRFENICSKSVQCTRVKMLATICITPDPTLSKMECLAELRAAWEAPREAPREAAAVEACLASTQLDVVPSIVCCTLLWVRQHLEYGTDPQPWMLLNLSNPARQYATAAVLVQAVNGQSPSRSAFAA